VRSAGSTPAWDINDNVRLVMDEVGSISSVSSPNPDR
jgi:hypothetical protein